MGASASGSGLLFPSPLLASPGSPAIDFGDSQLPPPSPAIGPKTAAGVAVGAASVASGGVNGLGLPAAKYASPAATGSVREEVPQEAGWAGPPASTGGVPSAVACVDAGTGSPVLGSNGRRLPLNARPGQAVQIVSGIVSPLAVLAEEAHGGAAGGEDGAGVDFGHDSSVASIDANHDARPSGVGDGGEDAAGPAGPSASRRSAGLAEPLASGTKDLTGGGVAVLPGSEGAPAKHVPAPGSSSSSSVGARSASTLTGPTAKASPQSILGTADQTSTRSLLRLDDASGGLAGAAGGRAGQLRDWPMQDDAAMTVHGGSSSIPLGSSVSVPSVRPDSVAVGSAPGSFLILPLRNSRVGQVATGAEGSLRRGSGQPPVILLSSGMATGPRKHDAT
jgi:hypothetical protein